MIESCLGGWKWAGTTQAAGWSRHTCGWDTVARAQEATVQGDLQDGGVRHGDHLPPHKYIKNTSTCGTTPTEHLMNAGRRTQTSQKARKYLRTWPCGRQGLSAPAWCQDWASEVGEPSSRHWTTRDFLVPHNINQWELSQRSPSQC